MTPDLITIVLLIHFAATLFMTGVIWFVQVVHYPLMDAAGEDSYLRFHERHQSRTSLIVGPPMVIELVTAIALLFFGNLENVRVILWANLLVLFAIWTSTFLIQVPCHERLAKGFCKIAHKRLVQTNWIRTAGWSVRTGLVLAIVLYK